MLKDSEHPDDCVQLRKRTKREDVLRRLEECPLRPRSNVPTTCHAIITIRPIQTPIRRSSGVPVPVYGSRDARRDFGNQFRRILIDDVFRENFVFKTVYVLIIGGELKGILITRVNDFLIPFDDGTIGRIVIKYHLIWPMEYECNFALCDLEVTQTAVDDKYTIRVTFESIIHKIKDIHYDERHKNDLNTTSERLTETEQNKY